MLMRRYKSTYKETSASARISIGEAVIMEEAGLMVTRQPVNDGEAEVEHFKRALEQTV